MFYVVVSPRLGLGMRAHASFSADVNDPIVVVLLFRHIVIIRMLCLLDVVRVVRTLGVLMW